MPIHVPLYIPIPVIGFNLFIFTARRWVQALAREFLERLYGVLRNLLVHELRSTKIYGLKLKYEFIHLVMIMNDDYLSLGNYMGYLYIRGLDDNNLKS